MEVVKFPPKELWPSICRRPAFDYAAIDKVVGPVLEDVHKRGDKALKEYSLKFDKVAIGNLSVSEEEFLSAEEKVPVELKQAISLAIRNISSFHMAQKGKEIRVETSPGVICWQKPVPISSVGLYIPGGTAPLFSTILMLAIPAKIAGCSEIILCSPPDRQAKLNDVILYAAKQVGITRLFKVGGAQAIAAMAYGTESIPRVDKILGPGNQYVMAAKQLVARDTVAIDMPAGPSEVVVLADRSSTPAFVASDLLSQAEHMTDSQVMLISTDETLINNVLTELDKQLEFLPKRSYAEQSLSNSKAILVKSREEMMGLSNTYAPEHLIISTADADELAALVVNAGSVFIGPYTPESAGDYASGTNHTLPTHGWARAYSGVNLDSFYKKITFQKISEKGLEQLGPAIEKMALAEELVAHQKAIEIRLRHIRNK
jgi:histidinol dehydrogenase